MVITELDPETLARAERGDPATLGTLYNCYARPLYHLAREVAGEKDAADAFEAIFAALCRELPRYSGKTNFPTWLLGVSTRACLAHVRKQTAAEARLAADETEPSAPAAAPPPAVLMTTKHFFHRLSSGLDALPVPQRAAVALRSIEGVSYADIAHAMGINADGVRDTLFRAREALSRRIKPRPETATAEPGTHFAPAEWSAYADGEASTEHREAMRRHLAECDACAQLASAFKDVQQIAQDLASQTPPPPDTLRTRLLAAGAQVFAAEEQKSRWFVTVGRLLAPVIGVALVLFAWHSAVTPTHHVTGSLNRVTLTRNAGGAAVLSYDLTLRNGGKEPILISAVVIKDPFGETRQPMEPALQVAPDETAQRVISRPVLPTQTLPPGRYRISLLTPRGSIKAEWWQKP